MRITGVFAFIAIAALAQVADYANSGYKTEQGRARVAGTLAAHDREQTQRPRDLVAAMKLKPGMAVADVGTGVGYMLPFLVEAVGTEGKVFAEDIFPDFLEKARANAKAKNLANVTFIQGTDKDPKLPENTLDAILVLDVYHHFDYPAEMLAGLKKALKADGRLIIVDFYKAGFRDPKHIRLDQVDQAKETEANGFRLLSTAPFTVNRQYMSIFHKADYQPKAAIEWRDVRKATIEGQGWQDLKHPFDRLPAKAEGVVRPPVWSLAQNSAGIAARFVTDAPEMHFKWSVRKKSLALPHMPATGVSGIDLYARSGNGWRWLATGMPREAALSEKSVTGLTAERREYMLYFPLYNGLDTLEIGLPAGTSFEAAPARAGKAPVVFYGTSILQGGCASRPGMAYPSIIGRKFDWPTINLGFSGNGKTEPEMSGLLEELKPAAYVLDSLPNLSPAETAERVPPFFRMIRASHPQTPIVLVENVEYTDAPFVASRLKKYKDANAHLKAFYEQLKAEGDRHVYYVKASDLLGDDGEGTVDGTHPTDIGFARMADGVGRVLEPILKAAAPARTGGFKYPPQIDGAKSEVYKKTPQGDLNMYVLGAESGKSKPAMVFFFGGGWTNGSPVQFKTQAEHLVGRGMVAFLADYRVASRHKTKVTDCAADAKSAVRWIRANAKRFGVDPKRVVAGGGSAGGHLAALTGVIDGFDEKGEDRGISSRPNAMVLFNPALVIGDSLKDRVGADPKAVSPADHVRAGQPPALIFHGTGDTTVPFATAKLFCDRMKQAGNRCELSAFDGRQHGFFNLGRNGDDYGRTIREMDAFLESLKIIGR